MWNNSFSSRIIIRIIFISIGVCAITTRVSAQMLMQKLQESTEYISQGDYHNALQILNEIESQCYFTDNDTVKVLFNRNMGYISFENKDYKNAIHYFESVPLLYEVLNLKDIDYIESYLALGMANQYLGNDSIAEKYYRRGILKTVYLKGTEKYRPSFYLHLGDLYKERGDSILASECFKQINADEYGTLIGSHDENLELQAIEYRKNGNFEQAVDLYNKLITHIKETIGVTNNEYARIIYSKAIVLGDNLNRKEEALPLYEEVVGLRDDIGECSEEFLGSLFKYLQLLAYFGDEDKLNALLPEAVLTVEKCKNQYCTMALLYRLIGNGAYWSERYELAIPYYEKYIESGGDNSGNSMIEIPNMLAVSYILTNRPKNALPVLTELLHNHDLENHIDLKATILHNLGRTLMLLGQKSKARKYLTESNNLSKQLYGEDNPRTIQYIKECDK